MKVSLLPSLSEELKGLVSAIQAPPNITEQLAGFLLKCIV